MDVPYPWMPLQPNESIYIVAPAAKSSDAWLELRQACALIQAVGFKPVYDASIFSDEGPLQSACGFANTDEQRYLSFVRAVHSDSRVIWCFRGGYGSDRVAERLVRDGVMPHSRQSKLLIGFSDATVLLHYCRKYWSWPGLHAPVLHQIVNQKTMQNDVDALWQWLKGDLNCTVFTLQKMNALAEEETLVEAELWGGNLTVIQSGMGTAWEMPRQGIILFEEINEAPYRVARILQQWLSSGWLADVQVLIFADFIAPEGCDQAMDAVLREFAHHFPRPVLRCRGVGHGRQHVPTPMGVPAALLLGSHPTLSVRLAKKGGPR